MTADLEGDLGWMLGVVFRAYIKASDHALRDLPGGPRGYQVLTAAVGAPPRNQGAIAEELGIDRTVLTYLIDDLEKLGLVARHPDPADRRSRLVVATAEGRATWRRLQDELRRVEAHVLSPLPAADAASFQALLSQLACRAQRLDPLANLCEVAKSADLGGSNPPRPPDAGFARVAKAGVKDDRAEPSRVAG
ncbi:MAG TPA: MarR family winged helix-turn-helix transcriptional regulator [Streptosporangiaceae bacterium]|nr:MarR family winged helix-turn-helix transcriptional regulator [Streptosporangiaceae bacterium]